MRVEGGEAGIEWVEQKEGNTHTHTKKKKTVEMRD